VMNVGAKRKRVASIIAAVLYAQDSENSESDSSCGFTDSDEEDAEEEEGYSHVDDEDYLMACASLFMEELPRKKRRVILRAGGQKHGWWQSTLYSYAYYGDEQTCQENFRMNRVTMAHIHSTLAAKGYLKDNTCRDPQKRVPGFFKLAICLYFMAHGRALAKVVGDCGSMGESTVRKYMDDFCDGVFAVLQPIYMPRTPPPPERVQEIRANFAARRGVPGVAMAVDGTHIPFAPPDEVTKGDYRNYKGWYSILVLAFVNSFHLFVDADVGAAGKSGDNTVMKTCWLMEEIRKDPEAWLGRDGMIAVSLSPPFLNAFVCRLACLARLVVASPVSLASSLM
jgi:hypothetical protein